LATRIVDEDKKYELRIVVQMYSATEKEKKSRTTLDVSARTGTCFWVLIYQDFDPLD
jgi:hypothetical protein